MVGNPKRHLAAIMFTDLAGYTLLLGEDEEAARRVRERHYGDALEATGRYPEAVEAWGRAASIAGDREIVGLLDDYRGISDFAAVMRAVASRRLTRLEAKREAGGYVPAAEYATAFVRLGDTEAALDWLDRAAEERNAFSLTFWGDPRFDALREDPRFQAIVERVKI